jgi:hypothetical protein
MTPARIPSRINGFRESAVTRSTGPPSFSKKKMLKLHERDKTDRLIKFHQEIDVALIILLAPPNRTEHPDRFS